MKKKFLLPAILFLLCAAIGSGSYLFYTRWYFTLNYEPELSPATDRALNNPYQGWYQIFGYGLSDETPPDRTSIEKTAAAYPYELVLLEINLKNYRTRAISEAGLSQLEDILSLWQSHGKQMILRFLYDWNGTAKETEPEDISVILNHMDQTAAVFNEYKDCVYLLQGIYAGDYGEMHGSDYLSVEAMCQLAEHLATVTDPSIFLSVRTPAHWRTITGSRDGLTKENAFSGTLSARLGLFNDGMLGSESDAGTYGETSLSLSGSLTDKGTREEELAFQNKLCQYVPNGGEVIRDNPCNDFTAAIKDLFFMHVSYLDCDYDTAVLDKWRASVYESSTVGDCFARANGYDYIEKHLGYRYDLLESGCRFDTFRDKTATFHLSIKNSGFSVGYRAFVPSISVVTEDGTLVDTYTFSSDTRAWLPEETVTLSAPLPLRTYGTGSYLLYFQLYDPVLKRSIKLSNSLPESAYGCLISSFTVGK